MSQSPAALTSSKGGARCSGVFGLPTGGWRTGPRTTGISVRFPSRGRMSTAISAGQHRSDPLSKAGRRNSWTSGRSEHGWAQGYPGPALDLLTDENEEAPTSENIAALMEAEQINVRPAPPVLVVEFARFIPWRRHGTPPEPKHSCYRRCLRVAGIRLDALVRAAGGGAQPSASGVGRVTSHSSRARASAAPIGIPSQSPPKKPCDVSPAIIPIATCRIEPFIVSAACLPADTEQPAR